MLTARRPDQTALRPAPLPLLTAHDAAAQGYRVHADREMIRVRTGVYASRASWELLAPWERYLARVHAFAQARPGVVFAHESAAALLGLPVFGDVRNIHIFDKRRTRSLRYGDVCVHTGQCSRNVVNAGDLLVTSPCDTLLDLARVLPPAFGLAVADAVLRSGVSMEAVWERAGMQPRSNGLNRLEWVLARAQPASESPAESVSRAVIEWLGFAPPELQHCFRYEGHVDRSDFFWPEYGVVGEADGWDKYGTDAAAVREALRREKRREDRLRRYVRGFARWEFADAMNAVALERILLQAGLPQLTKPQPAMLATLKRHPRSR